MLSEEQIWNLLKTIPVNHPVPFKFSESGITRWLCPPGVAEGAVAFQVIDVRPRLSRWALYEGLEDGPHTLPIWCNRKLWQQEWYVYRVERNTALIRAMEELDELGFRSAPLPRAPGHGDFDIEIYPEDFGIETVRKTNRILIEAIEGWISYQESIKDVEVIYGSGQEQEQSAASEDDSLGDSSCDRSVPTSDWGFFRRAS